MGVSRSGRSAWRTGQDKAVFSSMARRGWLPSRGMIAFSSIFSIPLDDSAARARTRIPFKSTPFLAATTETRLIMQEASVEPSKTPGEGNSARPSKEAGRSVANVTLEGIKVVSQRNCPTFSVSEV